MTKNANGSLAACTQRLAEEAREVAHTTLLMEQGQSLNTWAFRCVLKCLGIDAGNG